MGKDIIGDYDLFRRYPDTRIPVLYYTAPCALGVSR